MASKLKVTRGTTYSITINYKVNGVATTLVGATLFFTVKSTEYDSDLLDSTAVLSKTKSTYVAAGDNAAAGIAVITIDPTDTQALAPGTYFYDIKVKNAAGEVYKLSEGQLILDGSPTNRIA